jgi:hypothetical protein
MEMSAFASLTLEHISNAAVVGTSQVVEHNVVTNQDTGQLKKFATMFQHKR